MSRALPTDEFSGVRLVVGPGADRVAVGGLADRSRSMPWSVDTRTQLGSVSKQVVAVLALMLAERAAVDLDRELLAIWPEAPEHWRGVTSRHLLTHTAGVSHWCECLGYQPQISMSPDERVRHIVAQPPLRAPGTGWTYSSPGYILAAALLERMTGGSYFQLVQEHIISLLNLGHTRVGEPLEDDAASGYQASNLAPKWDLASMPGTGDLTSTAADLAEFFQALHAGELIHIDRGSAFASSVPLDPSAEASTSPVRVHGYGPGHFDGSVSGRQAVLCPGDNPGYHALAAWLCDTKTCIIVLGNDEAQDVGRAAASMLP